MSAQEQGEPAAGEDTATTSRQIAMVLDLNKCIGCQTCTIACKKLWNKDDGVGYAYWNNVETHPGGGFPKSWQTTGGRDGDGEWKRGTIPDPDTEYGRAWTFNHQRVHRDDGRPDHRRDAEWLRPSGNPSWGPNWDEDHGAGTYPQDNHYFSLPRLCNHCTHPACLEACPRAAIYKRDEDGIVLVNQDRCHGYRFCVEACPYRKVYFDPVRQVTTKCLFCLPRVEQGVPPACARQCPGRLRFVGYLDDEQGPIWKLVHHWKVALPLHPEFGLGPNVFYVPPADTSALDAQGRPTGESRIPLSYLQSLFGSRVSDAIETLKTERAKVRRGETSELMRLLIAYDWHDNFRIAPNAREVL